MAEMVCGRNVLWPNRLKSILIASQLILFFFAIFSVKNSYVSNIKLWFHFNYLFKLLSIYMQYSRYGKNSFRFAASALWNSLPDHFRTENSFSQFRSLLQSWIGSKCRCSACRWLKFCFWFAYIFFIFLIIIFF
jgi:hypothetical protein